MKIGIITHFYRSPNCGGQLQAYALCKCLAYMNCDAEQICYPFSGWKLNSINGPTCRDRFANTSIYKCLKRIYRFFRPARPQTPQEQLLQATRDLFEQWAHSVTPHSQRVYSLYDVKKCAKHYDILITGSDQVWNLNWYNPAYFLAFAPSTVRKISYAASVCNDEYTDYQRKVVTKHLADFKAVSVREAESVRLIGELSRIPVEVTLDPTLLLDRVEWDEIADERLVTNPYLFCYYLGKDPTERRLAQEYAAVHHLKVVVINHIEGRDVPEDRAFADIALDGVTPGGFISLIKHAECVFTDSFHGCVFSAIYRKNVFVFGRDGHGAMSSRIRSVSGLFGFEDRFCDTPEKADLRYIENCAAVDYERHWQRYEAEKQKSFDFLRRNILD